MVSSLDFQGLHDKVADATNKVFSQWQMSDFIRQQKIGRLVGGKFNVPRNTL